MPPQTLLPDFSQPQAAVDSEYLSGDEVGACCEEEDGFGDVLGFSVAAHWGFVGEVFVLGCGLAIASVATVSIRAIFSDNTAEDAVSVGHDHAGGDAVDADFGGEGF